MTHILILILEFELFKPSISVIRANNVEIVVLVVVEHDCCKSKCLSTQRMFSCFNSVQVGTPNGYESTQASPGLAECLFPIPLCSLYHGGSIPNQLAPILIRRTRNSESMQLQHEVIEPCYAPIAACWLQVLQISVLLPVYIKAFCYYFHCKLPKGRVSLTRVLHRSKSSDSTISGFSVGIRLGRLISNE